MKKLEIRNLDSFVLPGYAEAVVVASLEPGQSRTNKKLVREGGGRKV
jgi:hypothetical protein